MRQDIALRRGRYTKRATAEPELIRRHRPDYLLVIFMVLLMMLGLVVLYSIKPALSQSYESNFVGKQVLFLLFGLGVFFLASRVPLKYLEKMATFLLVASLGASLLLAFLSVLPGTPLVSCVNGACRWFDFGFTSFQPAEFLKFGLVVYLAVFLAARMRDGKLQDIKETLLPIGIVTAISGLIVIVLQKDLGTGLVLLGITAAMIFVAKVRMKYILAMLGVMAAAAVLMIVSAPHRIERVMTFIGSSTATDASNYQSEQALIAIGSGGFFGAGLGQGIQAFGYLPEAANDSIFAVVAEIFGFVGTVAILLVFAGLVYRLLIITDRSERPEFKLMMAGITAWLGSHIVINIGAMVGIIPLTGITLPFLSFGGTSLVFTMAIMGMAFSISHYTNHKRSFNDKETAKDEDSLRGRRLRGSRDARSRRYQRA